MSKRTRSYLIKTSESNSWSYHNYDHLKGNIDKRNLWSYRELTLYAGRIEIPLLEGFNRSDHVLYSWNGLHVQELEDLIEGNFDTHVSNYFMNWIELIYPKMHVGMEGTYKNSLLRFDRRLQNQSRRLVGHTIVL